MNPKKPVAAHVRVPKTLFDLILKGRFTAYQLKIVLCVLRFTIGHMAQDDGARISRRFVAERIQAHERNVRAVMDGLLTQGVLVEVEPAKGRQPAKIALQQDASRWGIHAPDAPPLRGASGDPDKLRPYRFGEPLSARGSANNGESLSARGSAPSAGVEARTRCGRGSADSKEGPEVLLLNALDSGSTCEPPLSASQDEGEETRERRRRFCIEAMRGKGFDAGLTETTQELHELKQLVLHALRDGLTEAEMLAQVEERDQERGRAIMADHLAARKREKREAALAHGMAGET